MVKGKDATMHLCIKLFPDYASLNTTQRNSLQQKRNKPPDESL